jgi:hypothetical protein
LCLRNTLFDALGDKERADLEFEAVWTTSFQDPIFNDTWHREWIDHLLYTDSPDGPWMRTLRCTTTCPMAPPSGRSTNTPPTTTRSP